MCCVGDAFVGHCDIEVGESLIHEGGRFVGVRQGDAVQLVTAGVNLAPRGGDDVGLGVLLDGGQMVVSVGESLPCAVGVRRQALIRASITGCSADMMTIEVSSWKTGASRRAISASMSGWGTGSTAWSSPLSGCNGPAPFDIATACPSRTGRRATALVGSGASLQRDGRTREIGTMSPKSSSTGCARLDLRRQFRVDLAWRGNDGRTAKPLPTDYQSHPRKTSRRAVFVPAPLSGLGAPSTEVEKAAGAGPRRRDCRHRCRAVQTGSRLPRGSHHGERTEGCIAAEPLT